VSSNQLERGLSATDQGDGTAKQSKLHLQDLAIDRVVLDTKDAVRSRGQSFIR